MGLRPRVLRGSPRGVRTGPRPHGEANAANIVVESTPSAALGGCGQACPWCGRPFPGSWDVLIPAPCLSPSLHYIKGVADVRAHDHRASACACILHIPCMLLFSWRKQAELTGLVRCLAHNHVLCMVSRSGRDGAKPTSRSIRLGSQNREDFGCGGLSQRSAAMRNLRSAVGSRYATDASPVCPRFAPVKSFLATFPGGIHLSAGW
ncbi:hypothetical protein B0T16DRAFT_126829 [Cercophora newfieldiana]|uniref:Uncharacterized protein n=1 Tax=Cercophora newfieldiana TaxID=92897 RepID=A0AA39YAS7_9PEZI|nr:hypothetical protein B0T16DRAFT_126829 [Cercophora newfieldiana]